MNISKRLATVVFFSGAMLVPLNFVDAQVGKPCLVNFINETKAPVQLVITAPVPENLGRLQVNEGLEVDFNRGEVVEIRQNGRVIKTLTISQSTTERIRAAAMAPPAAPVQGLGPNNVPNSGPGAPLAESGAAPPPPPGMIAISNEEHQARELMRYLNQIRATPRSFTQLHRSLGDADVQPMPPLKWHGALQKAAERKAAWIVQTGQSAAFMNVDGQQVGMNRWMREAGYALPARMQDNATNFEVRTSAKGPLAGIGRRAVNSFISQGKDGSLATVLLGRSGWKPCTDIGAAVASDRNGTFHVVVLVGFQESAAPSIVTAPRTGSAPSTPDPTVSPQPMQTQSKLVVTNNSRQLVFVSTRTANTASRTPVLPGVPADIPAELGTKVTVTDFQGNVLRALTVSNAVEKINLPAAAAAISTPPGPPVAGGTKPNTSPTGSINTSPPRGLPTTSPGTSSPPALVFIPSLENRKKDDAVAMLLAMGLKPNPKPGKKSPNQVFDNMVYQQSPAYLAQMPTGTEVTFEYYFIKSLEQPKNEAATGPASVPNVLNEYKCHAEDALTRAGFTPHSVPGDRTSDDSKIGRVYSQDVAAGTIRNRPANVTIRYYMKNVQADQSVQVPDVTGMSRWDAEMRLLRSGFAPQRIDGGTARLPIELGMVCNSGGDIQVPSANSTASPGSTVTYKAFRSLPNIGPYDANSPDPIPNMSAVVNANGSIDIAWSRSDGKAFYSRYSGNNWQQADHLPIPGLLRYIAGMCKDEAGNSYLTTMRQEYVRQADWDDFRAGLRVAELWKIPPGSRSPELVANLNQKKFVRHAITNPLNVDSRAFTSARMAYGSGALFCAFGQNNAGNHSSVGMFGAGTTGNSVYDGVAGQHPCEVNVHFDGNQFLMAQTFEAGVGLTKLTPQNGVYKSSQMKLVFQNEGHRKNPSTNSFLKLGGIANTSDGYLLLLSSAEAGYLWNYYPSENVPPANTPARLFALRVPRTFDAFKTFDWGSISAQPLTVPQAQSRQISNPAAGNSHVRPKLVDLGRGKLLVLSEERTPSQDYVATLAMVIDEQGQVLQGSKLLPESRLHASNDAFRFPNGNAGWVSGDAIHNRINLHVIDSSLNVQKHVLPLPE